MTTTQTNIFEYATRNKLRFAYCGNNSVEELWDLKLEDLDNIYKALNKQAKSLEEDSLLTKENSANEALTIKIEIIKYIVSVKISEQKAKTEEAAKKAESQKIMEILNARNDKALENLSDEELRKRLADLNQ